MLAFIILDFVILAILITALIEFSFLLLIYIRFYLCYLFFILYNFNKLYFLPFFFLLYSLPLFLSHSCFLLSFAYYLSLFFVHFPSSSNVPFKMSKVPERSHGDCINYFYLYVDHSKITCYCKESMFRINFNNCDKYC